MEKVRFLCDGEEESFYVLEQTRVGGYSYVLVADSKEDEANCLILKDVSKSEDKEAIYEIVEDDVELSAVLKIFEELLELSIEM